MLNGTVRVRRPVTAAPAVVAGRSVLTSWPLHTYTYTVCVRLASIPNVHTEDNSSGSRELSIAELRGGDVRPWPVPAQGGAVPQPDPSSDG